MTSIKTVDGIPEALVQTVQENPCKSKARLGAFDLLVCGDAKDTEHAPDAMIHDAPAVYYEIRKMMPVWKATGWFQCKLRTVGPSFFPTGEDTRAWLWGRSFVALCAFDCTSKRCTRAKASGAHPFTGSSWLQV